MPGIPVHDGHAGCDRRGRGESCFRAGDGTGNLLGVANIFAAAYLLRTMRSIWRDMPAKPSLPIPHSHFPIDQASWFDRHTVLGFVILFVVVFTFLVGLFSYYAPPAEKKSPTEDREDRGGRPFDRTAFGGSSASARLPAAATLAGRCRCRSPSPSTGKEAA